MKISHITIVTGLLCVFMGAQSFAAETRGASVSQQVQTVDARTQLLEEEVTELQSKMSELNTLVNANNAIFSPANEPGSEVSPEVFYTPSLVSIGPFLNIRTQFNGSELIVNTPSIREPSRLLLNRYKNEQSARDAGKPAPLVPRLELSGVLGGQTYYSTGYENGVNSDVDLTDAEIDAYVVMSRWITGFMAIVYDNSVGDTDRTVDNANIEISKAFITLGDLEQTPYYSSLGQIFVPFGRYSSSMIASPLTQKVARTKERTWEVGYKSTDANTFYGELYAFNASAGFSSERTTINDAGIDFGYNYMVDERLSGEIGASLISTIADSSGIQAGSTGGFSGFSCSTCSQAMKTRVPGMDIYTQVTYDPYTLVAEYVTATHKFDRNTGFMYGDEGAKPSAQNIELAYTLHLFDQPSSLAIGYGHTSQAAMLGLPNRRYNIAYNVSVWKHTLETIEFRREYNYSHGVASNLTGDALENLGSAQNVITAQVYVYF